MKSMKSIQWGRPFRCGALLIILLTLGLAGMSQAAAPVVSNLQVSQVQGSALVEMTYDLYDADGDQMYISAVASLDGGNTWTVPCREVSGAVGGPVSSGTGLVIQWDVEAELGLVQAEFCKVRLLATDVDPFPRMQYFRITGSDTLALSPDVPDTIGFGEPLHMKWQAITPLLDGLPAEVVAEMDTIWPFDDGILGTKWRLMAEDCNPGLEDCWQPRRYDEATGDSVSYYSSQSEFLFLNDGSGFDPWSRLLPSGDYDMKFTAIDIAGEEVPTGPAEEFSIVVNYDPETIILNGETDWAHPEDQEVYPYYIMLNDPDQVHHPFSEGDHIPDRSYCVFKALFKDDPRDLILNPAFRMGFTGNAVGVMELYTGGSYSFQSGASNVDTDPTWDAGINGFYADTLGFMPSPRTDFTFRMTAIDEHGRRDGTPAELGFRVGFPPCVQCVEMSADLGGASAYPVDLDCYDPDQGGHPCFDGIDEFYILQSSSPPVAGRTYLSRNPYLAYMAIHKVTGLVEMMEIEPDPELYYSFPSYQYSLGIKLHGQDDAREAWADPLLRMLAWKYQVDYECDPGNSIADGGGNDDLYTPTWGEEGAGDGSIEIWGSDGLWELGVNVYLPTDLVNLGYETFRILTLVSQAGFDEDLADELVQKCIRQMSSGTVRAIALDQTECGVLPLRPARYHLFDDVRPPAPGSNFGTWRDCLPHFGDIVTGLPLRKGIMASQDNEPVQKDFRIIFQDVDGDVGCDLDLAREALDLPAWNASK